jgi:hypothetical protein
VNKSTRAFEGIFNVAKCSAKGHQDARSGKKKDRRSSADLAFFPVVDFFTAPQPFRTKKGQSRKTSELYRYQE